MAVSLIGKDGSNAATLTTNAVPVQLSTTGYNMVTFNDNDATTDSFERLRVSEVTNVFEYTFGSILPATTTTIWETGTVGTASTDALTSNLYGTNIGMPVNTTSGRWYQSINHIRYQPGVSTILRFTFNHGTLTANQRDRIGMFTDTGTFPSTAGDGVFYENDAGTAYFVRRYMTQGAGGTEERVAQASWNLNKCQGAGDVADSSRNVFTLDFTKAQHLIMEYQYLGVGTIRFGWESGPNGVVWAHEMHSVNLVAEAWARTGTLPVRVESYNYGVALAHNLTLINCVVQQEGNQNDLRAWRYFGATSGSTAKTGGLNIGYYPIMGLRQIATNALTLRAKIVPTSVSITVITAGTTGTSALQVALLMLGTPNTGATYAVNVAGSACSVDIAATASTAITGSPIWTATIPNVVGVYTFDLTEMARGNVNLFGPPASGTQAITGSSNLTLAVGPQTSNFATTGAVIAASMNWKEIV